MAQLKRGHSKERAPDLKQLVYGICVKADGAVPVHFKAYPGNHGIYFETWKRLRTLLQHPRFLRRCLQVVHGEELTHDQRQTRSHRHSQVVPQPTRIEKRELLKSTLDVARSG